MNKAEFESKLKGIKLLEIKIRVTYSIYIGVFDDNVLDKVETLLKEAFPSSKFSIKLADSGVVEIEDHSNSQDGLSEKSDQILEKIKSSLSDLGT